MAKPPEKISTTASPRTGNSEAFAAEIAKRLQSILGKEQREQVIAQMVSLYQEERYSGPIAHPRHMQEYEAILPGSADRIIAMAERSLQHQIDMQREALAADVADQKAGRIFGLLALFALIGAALYCARLDKDVLAGLFLGAGALGTIGALINGRVAKQD